MRIPFWLALVPLAACGADDGASTNATAGASAEDRIECALAASDRFAAECAIERAPDDAKSLTIRHPDGGFRRLLVTDDGRGVIAADGFAPAVVQVIADKRIEVAIGGDRYRLPATIKGR
ncbi:MAG TPA: hypothetical protein VF628_05505 [Allosphingosinicella sp.]|jgi:hypothetical protein